MIRTTWTGKRAWFLAPPGSLFYTHSKRNGTNILYTITRPPAKPARLAWLGTPHTLHPAFEDGTDTGFRNVGQLQFEAGGIPKRIYTMVKSKSNGVPRQAEVAQGVPGRLRPRIFLTFRHYKGGRSSAIRTGRLTSGEIPGTHFQRMSRPQGTWFCRGYHGKNPQWHHRESIPGPPTSSAVP
jgi:hypothetical protein